MHTAYERRLILFYLSNVVSRMPCRTDEARNLVQWLLEHEEELQVQCPLRPSDEPMEHTRNRGDHGVPAAHWERLGQFLRNASAAARGTRPDGVGRRLRRLAAVTGLTRTDLSIMELCLRRGTGSLVLSMISDIFDDRRWTSGFCLREPVMPWTLGLKASTVRRRFAPDAPLVSSGLVSVDHDGNATVIDRLSRLDWLPKSAGSHIQDLLLDKAGSGELCWSDFDHVADDRNQVERIVKGALRNAERGVNILVYGPPGTGKTEFCKTLAARLKARLYVVGESDSQGNEPTRQERLQELRLAQRLLAGDRQSILLFDEMEDLLSGRGSLEAALFGSRGLAGLRAEGSKVFMNRLLEQTTVPVLWTSNAARETSPVLLRRMMFALELRQPPPKVRARIWTRHSFTTASSRLTMMPTRSRRSSKSRRASPPV